MIKDNEAKVYVSHGINEVFETTGFKGEMIADNQLRVASRQQRKI